VRRHFHYAFAMGLVAAFAVLERVVPSLGALALLLPFSAIVVAWFAGGAKAPGTATGGTEVLAQRRRVELLQAITAALSRAVTAGEMAEIIVAETARAMGAQHGGIWLVDGDDLVLVYQMGYADDTCETYFRFGRRSAMPLARAAASGTSLWIASRAEFAAVYPEEEARSRRHYGGEIGFFCAPLTVENEVVGAYSLDFHEPHAFAADERAFIEAIAGVAAQALSRARRCDAERAAHARAERAQREAEEAGRLKDEFIATLSHELRTPLTSILGWATLIRGRALSGPAPYGAPADLRAPIEVIERNARALAKLVEDLLDLSRLVTDKLCLDPRPTDLAGVLHAALAVVGPAAAAKEITLVARLDPDPCPFAGDPDRLRQVFVNLLSNAVKFTTAGGRVDLDLGRCGSAFRVVVRDTGRGISPAFLPHVFDRFRQADGTSTRRDGGLGIGLSLVKSLVELHGGEVTAESLGEGQGATFTVSLPAPVHDGGSALKPPAALVELPSARAGAPLEEGSSRGQVRLGLRSPGDARPPEALGGVRLLVCEEDEDSRALIHAVLSSAGAVVTAVGSAAELLAVLPHLGPQVLVSATDLRRRDGDDVLAQVRRLPADRGGQTPAVAVVACAQARDALRTAELGYRLHVAKPIEPGELIAAVRAVHDGGSAGSADSVGCAAEPAVHDGGSAGSADSAGCAPKPPAERPPSPGRSPGRSADRREAGARHRAGALGPGPRNEGRADVA
jgi:signal transduction histidine kinase/CheY-like chemotaxis protein